MNILDKELDEDPTTQFKLFPHPKTSPMTNALNFLQVIPRFDRRRVNYCLQREAENSIRVYHTTHDKQDYTISITGAAINRMNPKTKREESHIFWPSNREERVETAILKIASSGGIHHFSTTSVSGYGCYFSVYQIRELTGMNAADIKLAIEILNKSTLEIVNTQNTKETWSATFLPVRYVSAKGGSQNDKCYVLFHPAVMAAINTLQYRPYLYDEAEKHGRGLTRYFHKRLIIRFTYAGSDKTYNLRLRGLLNDYGRLPLSEEVTSSELRNFARDVRTSLHELSAASVIMPDFELVKVLNDDGIVIDHTIIVKATSEFIKQQKNSNRLVKELTEKIEAEKLAGLPDLTE